MNTPIIISLNKDTPVTMQKQQLVSLSKDGENIKKVMIGLAWENAKPKQSFTEKEEPVGFFGKLFGQKPRTVQVASNSSQGVDEIDLDASIICYDKDGNFLESIYFGRLSGFNRNILHMGDDRVGGGNKVDNEQIFIQLDSLPEKVHHIFATVSSFRGQNFSLIESASCRLVDCEDDKEEVKINLTAGGDYTGVIMAKIFRYGDGWLIKSIEEFCYSRTVGDLVDSCKKFIK